MTTGTGQDLPSASCVPIPAAAQLLSAVPREERAEVLRPRLVAARAALAQSFAAGQPGDTITRAFSCAVDAIVRELFLAARGCETPAIALVAVGGYGRAELCPSSDLDLWFVSEAPADDPVASGEIRRVTDEILYPLWDLQLDVGHAVRSVADSIALAADDLAAATALLDLRFLDGDEALASRLRREHRASLGTRGVSQLVERLAVEIQGRHARFGDTVFLLEPNVKNGEGGYRDLLVALWAAKARFAVDDFTDLVSIGQASLRQVEALTAARSFFLQVRTAAHLHARRRQDRLLFEVQEAIATQLAVLPDPADGNQLPHGPMDVKPAVAPAVEALMQRYYLNAKAVKREVGRLLERCAASEARRPVVRRVDHAFLLWNGQLSTNGPEIFRERPAEMVRIFRVAAETGAPIYGHTRDLIAEACGSPSALAATAAAFSDGSPGAGAAHRDFLAQLTDVRSPSGGGSSLLEQMHDLGLLAALMPEFGPCTGRVQHDLYHVFTVDQHQLYAVERLKALRRGELATELPTPTAAMREVTRPVPLFLGTLLHDVGKPLGRGHSEKGARLARAIAERFQLSNEERDETELLVRHHLLLAHVSQRRDLNDGDMIARLADQLGGPERLRDLYLLTIADMSMVAPGNLSSWKEQLLRDLYERALIHYRRGANPAGSERSAIVLQRRARVIDSLEGSVSAADLDAWLDGMSDRYYAQTQPAEIAAHVRLSQARAARHSSVAIEVTGQGTDAFELTVIADDVPGLLAKIGGVLLASRVDVLDARISSRRRAGARVGLSDEAIDVFRVRDIHHRAVGAERFDRLRRDLQHVVDGEQEVEALIAARRERSSLPARVTPHVPTEVEIDDEVSIEFTVIDVFTQDRPGVLYTITRTLSQLGVDIHLSKVATEGDRVADVFYVRDADGEKLDASRSQAVVAALENALSLLPT